MRVYLDHIGIACNDLESSSKFWRLIGLLQGDDETVEEQGVEVRFFSTHSDDPKAPRVELLKPTSDDTPIGRFIAKKGIGVQQVCFRVDDLPLMIDHLLSEGVNMIDETPRKGAHGSSIAFVHPRSTGGVLVELVQG